MTFSSETYSKTFFRDMAAGYFVALPVCAGVAPASNASLLSDLLAGKSGSILIRASLTHAHHRWPRGGHAVLDVRSAKCMAPNFFEMIHDFKDPSDPLCDVQVSLLGFHGKYSFEGHLQSELSINHEANEGDHS